ncbi:MAG: endopeptidase [Clostridia bacterium]|nr:endopeptidase [Clostridia bacterium]
MTARAEIIWTTLLFIAGVLTIGFIFFTLFPGKVPATVWEYFTPAEVEKARHYQQIMRMTSILAFLSKVVILVLLLYSTRANVWAEKIFHLVGGRYYLALLVYFVFIWFILKAVDLPFNFYGSYIVQHQWEFSTQTLMSWWSDYLKGSVLDIVLSGIGVTLLFWATGRWPHMWWTMASLFLTVWLIISTFLWPLIIAPLFNRFEPINEGPIKTMVTKLADRAGLQVNEILVMDASSRTTKANAYFTGLGMTKRIVLYDNLLSDYSIEEVEAVVAHEMAHWRQGHIARGLIWGVLANFLVLALLHMVLRLTFTYEIARPGPYPIQLLVAILLFTQLVFFIAQPIQNRISRNYEIEADRVALELTGNPDAVIQLHVNLTKKNLGDVAPPAYIEWLTYSHPSPISRIEAVKEWKDLHKGAKK